MNDIMVQHHTPGRLSPQEQDHRRRPGGSEVGLLLLGDIHRRSGHHCNTRDQDERIWTRHVHRGVIHQQTHKTR